MKGTTLLAVCLACGCQVGKVGGSAHGDAGGDAGADVMLVPVAITVQNLGGVTGPNANAMASFADGNGTPTTMVTTDASGKAAAMVPLGGSVAVVVPKSGAATADTIAIIMGVQANDDLTIGPSAAAIVPYGTAIVTPPAAATGGVTYLGSAGCASGAVAVTIGATFNLPLDSTCLDNNADIAILVTAYDATGALIATSTLQAQMPPAANTTAPFNANAFVTTLDSATITIANPPATAGMITAQITDRNGNAEFVPDAVQGGAVPQGPVFTFPEPQVVWTGYHVLLVVQSQDATATTGVYKGSNELPADAIDLTADALPFIAGATLTSAADGLPTVGWTAYATPVLGMYASLSYTNAGGNPTQVGIAFAPGATQTTLAPPQLPSALATYLPGAAPALTGSIAAYGGTVVTDANAFRATGSALTSLAPGAVHVANGMSLLVSSATAP